MDSGGTGALTERLRGGISMVGRDGLEMLSGICRFSSDDPSSFAVTMISVDLGSIRVIRMRTTAVLGVRGPQHLGDVMSGYFAVACVLSGSVVVEQNQVARRVGPGDAVCVDFGCPLYVDIADGSDLAFVYLPRSVVSSRSVDQRRIVGAVLSDSPTVAALAGVLEPLTTSRTRVGEISLIAHAVTDLALAALREAHLSDVPLDDGSAGLRSRVYEFIERNFTDPTLTVERVAAGVNVSSRYLHKLMESEDQSVYGVIRRRRVRCGVDLLADPALAGLSIGQIARRSGFSGLSQFGRAVRDLTGETPREVRRRAAAGR